MTDWNAIKNKIINAALDQPLLASLFVADFAILVFHRPPFIFSILMMGGLVALCLYYGQKLALFQVSAVKAKPAAAAEAKPATSVATETKPAAVAETKPVEAKAAKPASKPKAKAKT
jgi:hypothetical protein